MAENLPRLPVEAVTVSFRKAPDPNYCL